MTSSAIGTRWKKKQTAGYASNSEADFMSSSTEYQNKYILPKNRPKSMHSRLSESQKALYRELFKRKAYENNALRKEVEDLQNEFELMQKMLGSYELERQTEIQLIFHQDAINKQRIQARKQDIQDIKVKSEMYDEEIKNIELLISSEERMKLRIQNISHEKGIESTKQAIKQIENEIEIIYSKLNDGIYGDIRRQRKLIEDLKESIENEAKDHNDLKAEMEDIQSQLKEETPEHKAERKQLRAKLSVTKKRNIRKEEAYLDLLSQQDDQIKSIQKLIEIENSKQEKIVDEINAQQFSSEKSNYVDAQINTEFEEEVTSNSEILKKEEQYSELILDNTISHEEISFQEDEQHEIRNRSIDPPKEYENAGSQSDVIQRNDQQTATLNDQITQTTQDQDTQTDVIEPEPIEEVEEKKPDLVLINTQIYENAEIQKELTSIGQQSDIIEEFDLLKENKTIDRELIVKEEENENKNQLTQVEDAEENQAIEKDEEIESFDTNSEKRKEDINKEIQIKIVSEEEEKQEEELINENETVEKSNEENEEKKEIIIEDEEVPEKNAAENEANKEILNENDTITIKSTEENEAKEEEEKTEIIINNHEEDTNKEEEPKEVTKMDDKTEKNPEDETGKIIEKQISKKLECSNDDETNKDQNEVESPEIQVIEEEEEEDIGDTSEIKENEKLIDDQSSYGDNAENDMLITQQEFMELYNLPTDSTTIFDLSNSSQSEAESNSFSGTDTTTLYPGITSVAESPSTNSVNVLARSSRNVQEEEILTNEKSIISPDSTTTIMSEKEKMTDTTSNLTENEEEQVITETTSIILPSNSSTPPKRRHNQKKKSNKSQPKKTPRPQQYFIQEIDMDSEASLFTDNQHMTFLSESSIFEDPKVVTNPYIPRNNKNDKKVKHNNKTTKTDIDRDGVEITDTTSIATDISVHQSKLQKQPVKRSNNRQTWHMEQVLKRKPSSKTTEIESKKNNQADQSFLLLDALSETSETSIMESYSVSERADLENISSKHIDSLLGESSNS